MDLQVYAFVGAAFSIGLGAIGPGCGMGIAAARGAAAVARQPGAAGRITKIMLIGQAVTESPAIFALLIALFLLFSLYKMPDVPSIINASAVLSAGIGMGVGAFGAGIGSGIANAFACEGVGIQPDNESLILRTMLVGQAVAQSTSVYALVISMLLAFVV